MTAKPLTHEEETQMNLSWLWPKLVMPKSRSSRLAQALDRDLANLKPGSAGKQVREDPFSEANLNKRINRMNSQARMNEIGKIAQQLLIQTVTQQQTTTNKRYRLTSRDVQEALDSAQEIYDMTRELQTKQELQQQES